ncbi:hypothetical protein CXF42_09745, partial [Corynebacterium bovis]
PPVGRSGPGGAGPGVGGVPTGAGAGRGRPGGARGRSAVQATRRTPARPGVVRGPGGRWCGGWW